MTDDQRVSPTRREFVKMSVLAGLAVGTVGALTPTGSAAAEVIDEPALGGDARRAAEIWLLNTGIGAADDAVLARARDSVVAAA